MKQNHKMEGPFEPQWINNKYRISRTELRRHFNAVLDFIEARDDKNLPTVIYITNRGKDELVMMSCKTFETIFGKEMLGKLLSGELLTGSTENCENDKKGNE